jgi:asparagine synthase (glutamine-hydrolysing)
VALTGDAGDELFGGYDRYRALALTELFHRLPAAPRRLIGGTVTRVLPRSAKSKSRLRAIERLFERINEPTTARYLGWMTTFDEVGRLSLYSDEQLEVLATTAAMQTDQVQADPSGLLLQACAMAGRRDRVTQAMVGDILTYLPGDLLHKVDMASMAHSLECRGPFLDHRVVELAAAMPLDRKLRFRPGRSKVVLKRAFADLLPPPIKTRRKMGFGVPVGRWFRSELRSELEGVLLDRSSLDRGLFRPESVRTLVSEHVEGRREHGHRLWALVMLELWFRNHMEGPSAIPPNHPTSPVRRPGDCRDT